MQEDYELILHTLRFFRESRGLSQEALARKLEVSRNTIANIEQGRQKPSLMLFLRICNVLGLTVGVSARG